MSAYFSSQNIKSGKLFTCFSQHAKSPTTSTYFSFSVNTTFIAVGAEGGGHHLFKDMPMCRSGQKCGLQWSLPANLRWRYHRESNNAQDFNMVAINKCLIDHNCRFLFLLRDSVSAKLSSLRRFQVDNDIDTLAREMNYHIQGLRLMANLADQVPCNRLVTVSYELLTTFPEQHRVMFAQFLNVHILDDDLSLFLTQVRPSPHSEKLKASWKVKRGFRQTSACLDITLCTMFMQQKKSLPSSFAHTCTTEAVCCSNAIQWMQSQFESFPTTATEQNLVQSIFTHTVCSKEVVVNRRLPSRNDVCVLIPTKNPGTNLGRVVDSLVNKSDRQFGDVVFHFGIDWDDKGTSKQIGETFAERPSLRYKVYEVFNRKNDVSTIINHVFTEIRNATYFLRFNDDSQINTQNWNRIAIEHLQASPRDYGIALLTDTNRKVLQTHSFVSYRHKEIFGVYFPLHFKNWYEDDWITHVYPKVWQRRTPIELTHMAQKERYQRARVPLGIVGKIIKQSRKKVVEFAARVLNTTFSENDFGKLGKYYQ